MSSRKYYVVYKGGKLEEVDRTTYLRGFDDPYVVLTVQEDDELFIEPTYGDVNYEAVKQ